MAVGGHPAHCSQLKHPLLAPCLLRRAPAPAMARLPAAALLLLLGLAAAAAQGVTFQGPAGCADLPPSPPVDLKAAAAGSGTLLLTWSAPANGACVDEYQVGGRLGGEWSTSKTAAAPASHWAQPQLAAVRAEPFCSCPALSLLAAPPAHTALYTCTPTHPPTHCCR